MSVADAELPALGVEKGGRPRVAMFNAEWCVGPQINLGGADYWRLALPASKLFENGWDVKFARNLAEGPDGRLAVQDTSGDWLFDRDIVILQRWMGKDTARRLTAARATGQVIINDVDDHYWDFPEVHAASTSTDPSVNEDFNREHYRETVTASSLITVSTDHLAKELESWGPPVAVVRNYIDCDFWPERPPGDYVGWVGGLPWRGNDLQLLRETVVPWLRKRNQFFYHGGDVSHIGIGQPTAVERLGYDRVTTAPLTLLFNYPSLWEPLRVALIPIDDTTFGQSKSWVKGLEACARRIPFIYSAHDEYEGLGVGLRVDEPEDWVRHLESLEDPAFYAEEVERNYARALELDIDLNWDRWAKVLMSVVSA